MLEAVAQVARIDRGQGVCNVAAKESRLQERNMALILFGRQYIPFVFFCEAGPMLLIERRPEMYDVGQGANRGFKK